MIKKKSPSPFSKKNKRGKNKAPEIVAENLNRFAGSSDEEDEGGDEHYGEKKASKEKRVLGVGHDADADDEESDHEDDPPSDHDGGAGSDDGAEADEPFVTNTEANVEEEAEPGEKMASAMAKILGMSASTKTVSVVLAKTTTPLQRLQQNENEKMKALKQKRQANKERNLAAFHIPLSVATSNNVGEGRISITKELEQERLHRRVATRGVVALFNAIKKHQHASEVDEVATKSSESSKLTKHGFLDKIKSAAATMDSKKNEEKSKVNKSGGDKSTGKWDALKDDFMMKPKKNWDEESSDEEASDFKEPEEASEHEEVEPKQKNKRRKVAASDDFSD